MLKDVEKVKTLKCKVYFSERGGWFCKPELTSYEFEVIIRRQMNSRNAFSAWKCDAVLGLGDKPELFKSASSYRGASLQRLADCLIEICENQLQARVFGINKQLIGQSFD